MSDGAEKNFEPTQSRLAKARRDGNSVRSGELSGAFSFFAGLAGTAIAAPVIALSASGALREIAAQPGRFPPSGGGLGLSVMCALVPAACGALAGTALSILQSGGLQPVMVTLRLERLDPLQGFKRLISPDAALNALRAVAAVCCIVAALLPTVAPLLSAGAGERGLQGLADLAWHSALRCAFIVAALGALFGGVDFALETAKWRKKLRMSYDEVKRDQKEQDGDPTTKGRRRSMHREISRNSLKRLKDAAFVVVNPAHIAVAIEYRPPVISVPRVLLKAADESALRVRAAAAEYKIPLIENVPLARALFASTKPGECIPKETYLIVAEIVAGLCSVGAL